MGDYVGILPTTKQTRLSGLGTLVFQRNFREMCARLAPWWQNLDRMDIARLREPTFPLDNSLEPRHVNRAVAFEIQFA
ncbi:MAG TPA: hypothetical protein DCE44_08090 [Verrucomicrobiales bacterium]|nr:hypothetical protein [Verrucomicrobiales bacterium]